MVETFQNFDTRNPSSLNHLKIQEIDNNLQAQRNDQHAETVAALFPIPAIVPLRVKNAEHVGKPDTMQSLPIDPKTKRRS